MNQTVKSTMITELFLLGFPGVLQEYYPAMGIFFLFLYLTLAGGNLFIITFVYYEKSLQKPTYIIFCNLAAVDFAFGTTTIPKIIAKYLFRDETVTFNVCFVQMFFVHYFGSVTSLVLMLMAVDRFIAICNPLRYPSLVTNHTTAIACGVAWVFSVFFMIITVTQITDANYCNSNIIVHCYCDHNSITRLACSDIQNARLFTLVIALLMLLGPLAFIIFSYTIIIITVLKISNTQAKYKTFSTCTPQLLMICLYYLPRCAVYVVGLKIQIDINTRIMITMWYSLFPPLVNPIIFCFRTKELREAVILKLQKRKIRDQLKTLLR